MFKESRGEFCISLNSSIEIVFSRVRTNGQTIDQQYFIINDTGEVMIYSEVSQEAKEELACCWAAEVCLPQTRPLVWHLPATAW